MLATKLEKITRPFPGVELKERTFPQNGLEALTLPGIFPLGLSERKRAFLKRLKSPNGKSGYKRYMGAPIRYAGGKSLAVGLVVEHIPDNITKIVSPFLGAGSVEVACAVELGMSVVGYDIFDILVNYWQVQLRQPNTLHKRLLEFHPDRNEFKKVKERLKKHWTGEKRLGKFDLAAYFYFNHNTSYGPHFLGWPSSVYLQQKRYCTMLDKVRNFRVDNMQVECASF